MTITKEQIARLRELDKGAIIATNIYIEARAALPLLLDEVERLQDAILAQGVMTTKLSALGDLTALEFAALHGPETLRSMLNRIYGNESMEARFKAEGARVFDAVMKELRENYVNGGGMAGFLESQRARILEGGEK